jgi:hypothetical protein
MRMMMKRRSLYVCVIFGIWLRGSLSDLIIVTI